MIPLQLVPQLVGPPEELGPKSCTCASTAAVLHLASGGRISPSCYDVRRLVIDPATGKPDVTGGCTLQQMDAAAHAGWGMDLEVWATGGDFELAWDRLQSGKWAAVFTGAYSAVQGTRYDACTGFMGNHAVAGAHGKIADPLADGRRAGIPLGPEAWPKELLREFTGRLIWGDGILGLGKAYVAFAPIPRDPVYHVAFTPGAFYAYTVANGVIVGRVRRSFRHATSAPSRSPKWRRWPARNTGKRLVQVTKGALRGLYVQPGETHVRLEVT